VTVLLAVTALLEYLDLNVQKNMIIIECIRPVNTSSWSVTVSMAQKSGIGGRGGSGRRKGVELLVVKDKGEGTMHS